jgi:cysteine synthase A
MSKIYHSVTDLIGQTPLLELHHIEAKYELGAKILAKVESFNPAGSVKDRIAYHMIQTAEAEGRINQDTTIIEATSGNTGIGLAAIAAAKGYKIILVMSEAMSVERRMLLAAYGARIELTPAALGVKGAIARAEALHQEIPNSFMPRQFENPANPKTHYETTGPEIFKDTDGTVDIFVAGIGTGGTISGVGAYLKEQQPAIQIIGVEPTDSPVITKGVGGPHKIQGIGAGFIPKNLDLSILNEVIATTYEEAVSASRELATLEGLLVGVSSGASLSAAIKVAKRRENTGKTIVVLLPDTGERYLSTPLFQ